MRRLARAACLVAVCGLAFTAAAQPVSTDPFDPRVPTPVRTAVASAGVWEHRAVQSLSLGERIKYLYAPGAAGVARQVVTQGRKIGKFALRYSGTGLWVGLIATTALQWFYDQAQKSTGTPLDEWYEGLATGGVPAPSVWVAGAEGPVPGGTWAADAAPVLAAAGCSMSYIGGRAVGVPAWDGQQYIYYHQGFVRNSSGSYVRTVDTNPVRHPYSESMMRALAWQAFTEWFAAACSPGSVGASLADHLAANPSSAEAFGGDVLPEYLRSAANEATWPYTYAEPYGPGSGFTLSPAPNANQWHDNPFYDPMIDTDGDGWTDAEETIAGTDPMDDDDYPTVSPWPEPGEGEDPWPDADGDGIPDQFDPCPFHVYNSCAAVADIEIPDDYAREDTTQRIAAAAEAIKEALESGTAAAPSATAPELDAVVEPSLTFTAIESYASQIGSAASSWWDAAKVRMPFALGMAWLPAELSVSSSSCEGVQMEILGSEQEVGLCGTAIDTWLAGTGRNVWLGLVLLGFYFASARVVSRL